ncbi:MAG: universal stress protein [Solirubrobacteraceae bacterium]
MARLSVSPTGRLASWIRWPIWSTSWDRRRSEVFRDILVAVDGSAPAERALEEAIELARSTGASLSLVTVVPELSGWFLKGVGLPPPVNPAAGGAPADGSGAGPRAVDSRTSRDSGTRPGASPGGG